MNKLNKKSSVYSDVLNSYSPIAFKALARAGGGPIGTGIASGVGLADSIGVIHGSVTNIPTDQQIQQINNQQTKALIPGVASSRLARRRRKQGASSWRAFSQHFGPATSSLVIAGLAAIVGGTVGAQTGKEQIADGSKFGTAHRAMLGAAAGLGISGLGMLLAGVTPTRTKQQQAAHDASSGVTLLNLLVPGFATYNKYKSYGRLHQDQKDKLHAQNTQTV